MKIIDLLNKIAKGEEVPKKIKKDWEYEYKYDELRNEYHYMSHENKRFDEEWFIFSIINDEVEIIEEEKEIEKISQELIDKISFEDKTPISNNLSYTMNKVNELIDVINDMRDKEWQQ